MMNTGLQLDYKALQEDVEENEAKKETPIYVGHLLLYSINQMFFRMQIYELYISICCKSLCFGNKHYICIIYGSWALLMSLLKDDLMNSKWMKLNSFHWDTRKCGQNQQM